MEVDIRKVGKVLVVDLAGRLVAGTGAEVLKEVFNEILGAGWSRIVLNLSGITKIDSAGIGELVAGVRFAGRFEAAVKLLHVKGQVREILALSQLLPVLDVYYSEEEAVEAFGPEDESADESAENEPAGEGG